MMMIPCEEIDRVWNVQQKRKKMNYQNKNLEAIDLFIEDIKTPHNKIRTQAKKQQCEKELLIWQDFVLEYLNNIRTTIDGQTKI